MWSRKAHERVRRGAKWLDENFPDWRRKVSIEELSMRHWLKCVLGQVLGDFHKSRDLFDTSKEWRQLSGSHGFEVLSEEETLADGFVSAYRELNEAWKEVLSAPS